MSRLYASHLMIKSNRHILSSLPFCRCNGRLRLSSAAFLSGVACMGWAGLGWGGGITEVRVHNGPG